MTDLRIQGCIDDWWVDAGVTSIVRGQLVWAIVPHVGQTPYSLIPEGRTEGNDHGGADVQITRARVNTLAKKPALPVAALPQREGEVWTVHRAKTRPAVVLALPGQLPKALRGSAKWQTSPTLLVAPFYGATITGGRAGWPDELLRRIAACEYPHYVLDELPLKGRNAGPSVMRLDHLQPVGNHHDSVEALPFCLSEDALMIVDEWLDWLVKGKLDPTSILADARHTFLEDLLKEEKASALS